MATFVVCHVGALWMQYFPLIPLYQEMWFSSVDDTRLPHRVILRVPKNNLWLTFYIDRLQLRHIYCLCHSHLDKGFDMGVYQFIDRGPILEVLIRNNCCRQNVIMYFDFFSFNLGCRIFCRPFKCKLIASNGLWTATWETRANTM